MKAISTSRKPKTSLSESVDLDDLFDGRTWELTRGEDFDCSASSAATLVRGAFRERDGYLVVREDKGTNTITVTATAGSRWRKS